MAKPASKKQPVSPKGLATKKSGTAEPSRVSKEPPPRAAQPGRSAGIGAGTIDTNESGDFPKVRAPSQPGSPSPPSPRAKLLVGAPPPGPRPVPLPGVPPDPLWDAIALPDAKVHLRLWYHTVQMPSPMGGFLESLRVRSNDDGSGTVIFECSASSLRFALAIPSATRGEKKKVQKFHDEGEDPNCPRHDPYQRLNRVGPYLVCPLCGVRYIKA